MKTVWVVFFYFKINFKIYLFIPLNWSADATPLFSPPLRDNSDATSICIGLAKNVAGPVA